MVQTILNVLMLVFLPLLLEGNVRRTGDKGTYFSSLLTSFFEYSPVRAQMGHLGDNSCRAGMGNLTNYRVLNFHEKFED